ncbi:MAG TPA: flavin reductase family protein [Trebonia sp.]
MASNTVASDTVTSNTVASDTADGLAARFGREIARVPTCVSVVTTDGPAGRAGQTVSAVATASYDPPMLVACIQRRSPASDAIEGNGTFTVNFLATRHDHVSDTFAGRPWPGKDRWDFSCGDWSIDDGDWSVDGAGGPDGHPRLADALLVATCRVAGRLEAGGHRVYLGEVTELRSGDGDALVYVNRRYGRHTATDPSTFPEFPQAKPQPRAKRPANPAKKHG